jgi:hypothetical protein
MVVLIAYKKPAQAGFFFDGKVLEWLRFSKSGEQDEKIRNQEVGPSESGRFLRRHRGGNGYR